MDILITGIDTTNESLINSLVNVIQQTYPTVNFAIGVSENTVELFSGSDS